MKGYNFAIVGATGMVGRKFAEVLGERHVPVKSVRLFASNRSAGSTLDCLGSPCVVQELTKSNVRAMKGKIDFALFSAGAGVSEEYAPLFADIGAIVIDNSSFWRMHEDVPLVVPEVNPEAAFTHRGIIANPNCSTIQAVVALKPLHDRFRLKRVVYSTYQAVSGAGMQGFYDLRDGVSGAPPKKFPKPIAFNILPHIDVFLADGYTKEERKMIDETRKILGLPALPVTATAARVPVFFGHSESINAEFEKPCTLQEVRQCLSSFEGLTLADDPERGIYPTPLSAAGKDDVFVGRVRLDDSVPSGVNLWVVADNIRKGAATNAVQIAELLIKKDAEDAK